MSGSPPFTIRIRTDHVDDMDWMVQPDEITFLQALEVISQVVPDTTITAFEYDDHDEEDERITVRSDEEMRVMFDMYFSLLSEEDMVRGLLPPLIIYPKVGKTAKNRNIHGLKIKTDKQSTGKQARPVQQIQASGQQSNQGQSSKASVGQPPPQEPLPQPTVAPPTQDPPKPQVASVQYQQPQYQVSAIRDAMATMDIGDADLEVLELLGKGNGGYVHRVVHKPTGTIMAVKVMLLDVSEEEQKKIISELEILSKCNCPTIIGFYKAFFIENRISICTEYMDGGSLDKYGQVPEPVLGRMAVSILQGLCYMWNLKILHRDIKPSNILVSTAGLVKLCDFGVSVQLTESIAKTYVGTNAYMAPERIQGKAYSVPADVWSLGILLFELATGRYPYGHHTDYANPMQLFERIITESIPPLPTGVFSPDFIDFVSNCTGLVPTSRMTINALTTHTFVQRHNDGNANVIAAYVQNRLPEILQQKTSS